MKKTLLIVILFLLVIYWSGCKKCYHCTNTCTTCLLTYGAHTIASQVLCTDSFRNAAEYAAAISADSAMGYVCKSSGSTYLYDFCVNKPGETNYINYFNKGGRATCTVK